MTQKKAQKGSRGTKNERRKQNNKMVDLNLNLSIIYSM